MHSVTDLKHSIAKLKPSLGGKIFYYCFPANRKVVLNNMHTAFADALTPKEYQKLAQAFYTHALKLIREVITLRFLSLEQIIQRVEVRGVEHVHKGFKKGKGVLWPTAHLGNWELTPLGARPQIESPCGEYKLYTVRKKIPYAAIQNFLFGQFERAGIHVIAKDNSLRQLLRALAQNGAVSIAFDQHVKVGAHGVLAKFFNRPVGSYKVMAKLAKRSGAAVIPAVFYREANGHHVCEFYPELNWIHHADPEEEIRLNTEAYNHAIEKAIWAHPDQWQWRYRRWRN